MSENSINFCVNRTKDFKTILGSTLKNIACFGKNDLRVLAGTISVQPQHLKAIDSIFDLQRKTSSNINSHLTDQEKLILKARDKNSLLPVVIPFYLKQVGYWISEKHCATSPADLPLGANGTPETQSLCPYRQVLINDLRTRFPEEFKIVSTVLNTPVMTLEELKTLHSSIFACSINSVADLDNFSGKVRTACDYENLNRYFWRRWVSAGPAPASLTNNPLWSLFGMNSDSYFALS